MPIFPTRYIKHRTGDLTIDRDDLTVFPDSYMFDFSHMDTLYAYSARLDPLPIVETFTSISTSMRPVAEPVSTLALYNN
jgi:hypothetical protein